MSSPDHAIQFSDFAMINRVLVRAGYRSTLAEVDIGATSDAATFLLEKFGNGVTSEDDLVALLNRRGRSLEQAAIRQCRSGAKPSIVGRMKE